MLYRTQWFPLPMFFNGECKSGVKSQTKSYSNLSNSVTRYVDYRGSEARLIISLYSQPTASEGYAGTKNRTLKTKLRVQIMLRSFRSSRSPNSPKFLSRFSLTFLLYGKITKPGTRNLFIYHGFVLVKISL